MPSGPSVLRDPETGRPDQSAEAFGRFAIAVTRGTGKVDLEVARGDFARRSLTLGTLGEPAEVEIELERKIMTFVRG